MIWVKYNGSEVMALGGDERTLLLQNGKKIQVKDAERLPEKERWWEVVKNDLGSIIAAGETTNVRILPSLLGHRVFIDDKDFVTPPNPVIHVLEALRGKSNGWHDGPNTVAAMNFADEAVIWGSMWHIDLQKEGRLYVLKVNGTEKFRHANPVVALIGGLSAPNHFQ